MSYFPVKPLTPVDTGTRTDFSISNVLDSAYTDLKTLTVAIFKIDCVHNGGGEFILRKNGTDIGFIAPGYKGVIDFQAAIGDVIRIKSVSGTVNAGKLFLNFLG